MSHNCHAIGCKVPVEPKMFMCKTHWFMVPDPIRRSVWHHYRPGQERDWRPSLAYCMIAKRAVEAVAKKEGRTVTGKEDELRLYDYFMEEIESTPA